MMRALAITGAFGLLAGCALPPVGVTPADLAAFDQAVASIGCEMVGESDYLPVELQTGLTRVQVVETVEFKLMTEEAVRLENGGVRLVCGPCAPA